MNDPVKFKKFEGTFTSWDRLFDDAAAFAQEVGRDRVVSISHSSDGGTGLVVVWYWGKRGDGGALSEPSGGEVSEGTNS
jgi:hypothetical protein